MGKEHLLGLEDPSWLVGNQYDLGLSLNLFIYKIEMTLLTFIELL